MSDTTTTDYLTDVHGTEAGSHVLDVRVVAPVRTVDRPARSFTTQQVAVGDQPQRVASDHQARARLLVQNVGPEFIYVAQSQAACTPTTGYPVGISTPLALETVAEVWVVCAPGKSATVALLAQYRDG